MRETRVPKLQAVLTRAYLIFAILVFSLTAIAKLSSDFGDPKLQNPDPFLRFLSAEQLLVGIAIVEIIVVVFLIRSLRRHLIAGIAVVVWLSSLFGVYRLGFQFAPEKADVCKCFGVGSILGEMEPAADRLSIALLLLLLTVGAALLWLHPSRSGALCRHRRIDGGRFAVLTFLLFSPLIIAQDSSAPGIRVQGQIAEQILNPSGEITATNSFGFDVRTGRDGQWNITWTVDYPQWSSRSTEHVGYNGKDVFSVVYADKRLDANLKPVPNLPFDANRHPARVCRGPFPVDHSSCVGLLWLTFMGGDYLARSNSEEVPDLLVASARTDPGAWSCDFAYQLHENSNRLLASCSFTLNPSKVSSDLMDYPEVDEPGIPERVARLLEEIKRLKAAEELELPRSTYRLEDVESRDGVLVPTRFSATRYSPPGATAGHFAVTRWAGTVTNMISSVEPADVLPPILGRLTVEDRRFKERTAKKYINQWFYDLPGNAWIESVSDRSFLGTNQVRFNVRQSIVVRRTGFYLSVILFAVLVLLPIFYLVRRRRAVADRAIHTGK